MVLLLTERFCNVIAEKRKIRKKEEMRGSRGGFNRRSVRLLAGRPCRMIWSTAGKSCIVLDHAN